MVVEKWTPIVVILDHILQVPHMFPLFLLSYISQLLKTLCNSSWSLSISLSDYIFNFYNGKQREFPLKLRNTKEVTLKNTLNCFFHQP